MGILLEAFRKDSCCLCGATENLTGEHKIKASALLAEFGSDTLAIGTYGDPDSRYRFAQSVNSKKLHFEARLCAKCNNERTQAPDLEFDRFHAQVRAHLEAGRDPSEVFLDERYREGSEPYLNVFRYFAKLLCCHVAGVGGPRRVHVARFALGEVHQNCVWLLVKSDWTYRQIASVTGPQQYASHGGLVVYSDKRTGRPKAFHSTLTVGPVQYAFHSRLSWPERLELRLAHRDFHAWCMERAAEAANEPMSETDRLRLGLDPDEPEPLAEV